MKNAIYALVILMFIPGILGAQAAREYSSLGYAYGAPAVGLPDGIGLLHVGLGGEGRLYRALHIAAEIGYAFPYRSAANGIGLLSVNGSYRFTNLKNEKLVPFVTGGYSGLFRAGWLSGMNAGGGVDYWFRERIGWRAEVRDYFRPASRELGVHLLEFRFGISFR